MILEARARKVGKLADHLARIGRDANKRVAVRAAFVRNCPVDITETLRLCAAFSRTVSGVSRDFVHLKISPNHELSDEELDATLAAYESEYGIPLTTPRHVTQHWKGDRPSHFHVIYGMVDPKSGKALRLWKSFERDEAIARSLEVRFGEPITASTRAERVAELLLERGEHAAADAVLAGARAERHRNADKAERAQATRRKADIKEIDGRLLALWRHCGADLKAFIIGLENAEFQAAHGDKVVMLIDLQSGEETALAKHLNRVTKAAGRPALVKERAVRELVGDVAGLAEVRAAVAAQAPRRARDAVAREFDLFWKELAIDEDGIAENDDRAKRVREKSRRPEIAVDPVEARVRILADYRRRDRIRRARVARAFLMARVLGSRDVRRLAFFLAGAGAIMTGAGLVTALAAAGIAISVLPTYEKAHRTRRQVREEREVDFRNVRKELALAAEAARVRQETEAWARMQAQARLRPRAASFEMSRERAWAAEAARVRQASEARARAQAQSLMRSQVEIDRLRWYELMARSRGNDLATAARNVAMEEASIRARIATRPDSRAGDHRGRDR